MKRIILIISLLPLLLPFGAAAQSDADVLRIDSLLLERTAGQLTVSFQAQADPASVKNGYTLLFTPVLEQGANRQELPPVYIQTRRAAVKARRNGISFPGEVLRLTDKTPHRYRAEVPYESWMHGADFELEAAAFHCTAYADWTMGWLSEDLFAGDTTVIIRMIEAPVVERPATTGEQLAKRWPFVAPLADFEKARDNIVAGVNFDENMPLKQGLGIGAANNGLVEEFVDRNREGSLIVYYALDSRKIDMAYRDNAHSLEQIVEAVRMIEASEDSRVARVVIAGFASPEGRQSYNEQLAWDRAQAVRNWLLERTSVTEDKVRVYNGAEDWRGLRRLVEESALPEKAQVLEIIDRAPQTDDANGRLAQLKRINNGETYRYLVKRFFPELRNAAYIKVYFENNND